MKERKRERTICLQFTLHHTCYIILVIFILIQPLAQSDIFRTIIDGNYLPTPLKYLSVEMQNNRLKLVCRLRTIVYSIFNPFSLHLFCKEFTSTVWFTW
jgi:hypothetical protein